MKAKDLIKILEKHPEWSVSISIDISTNEDDYDHRAFGDNILEVINEVSSNRFTICLDGEINYKK